MKVSILKSNRKSNGCTPIAQCGGVLVRDDETLAVRADLAHAIKRQHPDMQEIGTEEVDSLRGGVYEVRKDSVGTQKASVTTQPEENDNEGAPVKAPGDRSMARTGRSKTKRK